jgi:hypothetical protein
LFAEKRQAVRGGDWQRKVAQSQNDRRMVNAKAQTIYIDRRFILGTNKALP